MDRDLLEALRLRAADEGRDEYEVLEEAARLYLECRGRPSVAELIERARGRREQAGLPELPEDEAMRIAVAEQHSHRRESGERSSGGG